MSRPTVWPFNRPNHQMAGGRARGSSRQYSQEKPARVTLLALLLPLVSWKILETQRSRGEDPAMCSFLEPPS